MKKIALELKNIGKSYQDGDEMKVVLDDINLSIEAGQFVAIVGPSGSGKSTLLSIAGALLTPDRGQILIDGHDISGKSQKEQTLIRREQIGFIFQNHQLLSYLTVKEHLQMIGKMHKEISNNDIVINELLEDLDLTKISDKHPEHLSGGERQRTAIARAFMNNPAIILADEPTASLDGKRGYSVVEMIKKEVKKMNKAAIMVTHDERVLDLVDVVYRLDNGKLYRN